MLSVILYSTHTQRFWQHHITINRSMLFCQGWRISLISSRLSMDWFLVCFLKNVYFWSFKFHTHNHHILVCFIIKDQKHCLVMIGRKFSNLHTYFISDLHKQKFHSCKPGTLAGGASCEKKAPEEALAAAKEMLGDAWKVRNVSFPGNSMCVYVYVD